MYPIRRDVVQRPQHEIALGQAWMGNDEIVGLQLQIGIEEDVDIDQARPVADAPLPSQIRHDLFDGLEKLVRR